MMFDGSDGKPLDWLPGGVRLLVTAVVVAGLLILLPVRQGEYAHHLPSVIFALAVLWFTLALVLWVVLVLGWFAVRRLRRGD